MQIAPNSAKGTRSQPQAKGILLIFDPVLREVGVPCLVHGA
jgi:hypothetical protein